MASFNSQQVANTLLNPVVKNRPYDVYGRVRRSRFTFLVGTDGGGAAIPAGSVIVLCALPVGAKILGGKLVQNGLGASTTASVGLVTGLGTTEPSGATAAAGTGTEFLSAAATSSAGATSLANSAALNYGYIIQNPQAASLGTANSVANSGDTLILTTGGATLTAGQYFSGEIEYIVD